jgi:S-formylglutathione hydrolase FrmB
MARAQAAVMGHSMGGHGALVLGLRNPGAYRSISAFSPIAHPSAVPWGHKALGGYLGDDRGAWKQYDATELVRGRGGPARPQNAVLGPRQGRPAVAGQEADQKLGLPCACFVQTWCTSAPGRLPTVPAPRDCPLPCWYGQHRGGLAAADRRAAARQAGAYDGPKRDVLIDVGTADPYLAEQLRPDDFAQAAAGNKALAVQLRKQARQPRVGCSQPCPARRSRDPL